MSKENFANRIISRLAQEYDVEPDTLAHHRARLEEAALNEATITDEELDKLLAGTDASRELNEKYPLVNEVSLAVVEALENSDLESDDDDEDDEDEDEEDDEDSDDEDDDEDE